LVVFFTTIVLDVLNGQHPFTIMRSWTVSARITNEKPTVGLRERKKKALRKRIMDASVVQFRERGYEAVTVDEICSELGISKATFFRYFPTKDAVLRQLGATLYREYERTLAERVEQSGRSVGDRIREFYALIADTCEGDPKLTSAVIESGALDPVRHPDVWEKHEQALTVFGRILQQGQEAGEIRTTPDARSLALMLEASCYAIIARWVFEGDTRPKRPDVVVAVNTFLEGAAR
jgi:AcrR family transcriptional regulator